MLGVKLSCVRNFRPESSASVCDGRFQLVDMQATVHWQQNLQVGYLRPGFVKNSSKSGRVDYRENFTGITQIRNESCKA